MRTTVVHIEGETGVVNIENVFPDSDDELLANVPESKITQVEINSEGGSTVKDGSKTSLRLLTDVPSLHSLDESSSNPIRATQSY